MSKYTSKLKDFDTTEYLCFVQLSYTKLSEFDLSNTIHELLLYSKPTEIMPFQLKLFPSPKQILRDDFE